MNFFFILIFLLINRSLFADNMEFDKYGRLLKHPDKIEVTCPSQVDKTGVILAIGQSNSANHAEKLMLSRYHGQVYNYFNGKCYLASSPLLGATGYKGEFLTPLADYLIELGIYKNVILITSGVGGSKIVSWKKDGPFNKILMDTLREVRGKYTITDIIWHQGESDYLHNTPSEDYKNSFYSVIDSIREGKVPFYYAIATRCLSGWSPDNSIAQLQKTLANEESNIYLGADTDSLVSDKERIDGYCHFTEIGQLKTAYSYAMAIYDNHHKN